MVDASEPNRGSAVDNLEVFIMISNAAVGLGFETLSALGFGFRLKMMWTVVSAAGPASLKKSSTVKFIASHGDLPVFQTRVVGGVGVHVF